MIQGLDIAVRYVPAEDAARVGGDLYDVFLLDDDHLALVIGDVSGHGLKAASFMAMTAYMIKGFLMHGMSPGEALQETNSALSRNNPEMSFVTAFVSILDVRTHDLLYANAGHHMPVVIRSGACRLIESQPALPLAIDEDAEFATLSAQLTETSGLLFYTDGVIEARQRGELFGEERLCNLCGRMIGKPSQRMLDTIVQEVRALSGIFQDDIALLAVKWRE
jgi:sigma-B regulation protein RsbU (phosphoserine phosphatase)